MINTKVSITGNANALHYPLSELSDMLYIIQDKINSLEGRYGPDELPNHLPFEFEVRGESGNGSRLSVKIERQ